MSGAELDLKDGMLVALAPTVFEIKAWTPGSVTAQRASLRYSIADGRRRKAR
jgi:hypothetical protein